MSRVLVVEDSPTQAQEIKLLLEDAGFQVALASQGLEAKNMIRHFIPDIVVTDMEMPEMNGLQLVEFVRKEHSDLPVILMTAFGSEDIAALALRKGAASYVPKSYLMQDIVPTLKNILAVTQVDRFHHKALACLTQMESHFALENDPVRHRPHHRPSGRSAHSPEDLRCHGTHAHCRRPAGGPAQCACITATSRSALSCGSRTKRPTTTWWKPAGIRSRISRAAFNSASR